MFVYKVFKLKVIKPCRLKALLSLSGPKFRISSNLKLNSCEHYQPFSAYRPESCVFNSLCFDALIYFNAFQPSSRTLSIPYENLIFSYVFKGYSKRCCRILENIDIKRKLTGDGKTARKMKCSINDFSNKAFHQIFLQ